MINMSLIGIQINSLICQLKKKGVGDILKETDKSKMP